jgi:Ca2+-binding RTX toxin-like protein
MRIPVVLAIATSLVVPAAADASGISSDGTTAIYRSGSEAADLEVFTAFGGGGLTDIQVIDHHGGLIAGDGCTGAQPVTCSGKSLDIRLNGGNDRSVGGGDGRQTVSGGTGEDVISSGGQRVTVSGGGDDDIIRGNANETSLVHGDGGNDVLWGTENFPFLYGDGGNDFIFADGQINSASGGSGNDQLVGVGQRFRAGTMDGGSGDDVIAFLTPSGEIRNDTWKINAGDGADTVVGSVITDTIVAGPGGDNIDVTGDGVADSVDCGSGFDRVYADAEDFVASNCELRYDTPMPSWWLVDHVSGRAAGISAELSPLFFDPRPPFDA